MDILREVADQFSKQMADEFDQEMINETQKDLKQRGFYTGQIDGRMGPLLKQALEDSKEKSENSVWDARTGLVVREEVLVSRRIDPQDLLTRSIVGEKFSNRGMEQPSSSSGS